MPLIRLATRESALALWQTEHVAARLRALHPGLEVALVPMTTRGDQILDRALAAVGGKGLFLKELEVAMLEGRADAAVHSLKDVPMELDGPFVLAAILERADPFDAFVSNAFASLDALPKGARVGTSSLPGRRSCVRCAPTSSFSTCAATSTRAWRSSTPASTTPSSLLAPACSASASMPASVSV